MRDIEQCNLRCIRSVRLAMCHKTGSGDALAFVIRIEPLDSGGSAVTL
jgi:hypothetical protein